MPTDLLAAMKVMVVGLLMAALNALPFSASAMPAAHGRTEPAAMSETSRPLATADTIGHDDLVTDGAVVLAKAQAPCGDWDAQHGKLGCCVGAHCAASYAMTPPFDCGPPALEPQPILLPKSPSTVAGIGVGPALEPPRLSI